jgi:hypothetical protein
MATLTDALSTVGIRAFGVAMPVLAKRWSDGTMPTVGAGEMSIELASGSWVCPVAGTLRRLNSADTGVSLIRADGSFATGPGSLLTLLPQVELRLARLYAQVLEDATSARPGRSEGRPARPVPRYFLYTGTPGSDSGHLNPDEPVGQSGALTIHDADGMPIDPLAVAAAFQAFMVAHEPLQARAPTDAFSAVTQVRQISELAGTTPATRVWLSDHAGTPRASTNLTGLTSAGQTGLFTLDGGASPTIGKSAATGSGGAFPAEVRRLLKLGLGTTGRMGDSAAFPALPGAVSLARDFYSVRVVDLRPYLLGEPDATFEGTKVEDPPSVRINEPLDLLADGNDVLGAATTALTGAATEAIAVAQSISGGFATPAVSGAAAHWPAFPSTTAAPGSAPLTVQLRNDFNPAAAFFDDGDPATDNVDIVLTLSGLPTEATVRAYPRRFVADAREERGDGAGGIVASDGSVSFLLRDPLGLRRPGVAATIPSGAVLAVDVVVVTRSGQARVYGNVTAALAAAPTTTAPPAGGPNPFATATRRGVSRAGILGLATSGTAIAATSSVLDAVLALAGEGTPRDAPRLPTMARRELLVAGLPSSSGGTWRSVIAGGRLESETQSASPELGAPGAAGGRETQVVGASTQNGRLAYDVARMAMRRATNIVTRLTELAKAQWSEPAEPAELAAGAVPSSTSGTFAGAVLQTVAPLTETPELAILKTAIDPDSTTRPQTFDDLVDWVVGQLPQNLPFRSDIVNKLQELKDDNTLNESDKERLFNETEREIMSAGWGRRDAQWALRGAISRARRFIYIETPGLAPTTRDYAAEGQPVPPYAVDLLKLLDDRLRQATGLHVVICVPKFPDFASGYERLAAHEEDARRTAVSGLATASDPDPGRSRVVIFHPVGFPGRPSRLESTVVVVDDLWALVGSSTIRRRGLTFDGGSDLVMTDMELVDGRSPAISDFRRRLMAARLRVPAPPPGSLAIPDANMVRLRDGVEAFYVIRAMLRAGGLGRIEPLWNGQIPGVTPISPTTVPLNVANPEGLEVDLAATLAEATLAAHNRW